MNTINDGYGDDLTNDEVVARYLRWSHAVAGSMTDASSLLYDDLVQESMIEIWQVLEKKGGKANVSATYLTKAARYRMIGVVTGKPMVGGDSAPGPKSRPGEVAVDWGSMGSEHPFQRLLVAADLLSGVEWAYHAGEIAEALDGLRDDDKAYVLQRFWAGKTDTEIAAETETTNKNLGTRWARYIRPHLREHLVHLVEV